MNQTLPRPAAGALTLICAALAILVAPIAYAHDGEGTLVIEARDDTGQLTMLYVVELTWANDGHPAADATVTAIVIDPGGAPQTLVPMQSQGGGRYSGTVTFPTEGTWTVRFTAVTPAATLEIVGEATAASMSATTTTTQVSNDIDTSDTEPASPAETKDDDDGGVAGLLATFLALIAGGGVVGAVRARRTRRPS